MIEIYKVNNHYLKLNIEYELGLSLKKFFSAEIPNKRFHPLVKAGKWSGRIFFFNPNTNIISVGLFPIFVQYCAKHEYEWKLMFDESELYNNLSKEDLTIFLETMFKDTKYKPRDYQQDSILIALNKKSGCIQLPTGAGKTVVASAVIKYLMKQDKEILMIVPSVSLVNQFLSDCKSYGWTDVENDMCFLYSGQVYDGSKKICCSTWQSIYKQEPEFFARFNALIVDECLHPQTRVITFKGSKSIENIKVGDLVLSKNPLTKRNSYKPVTKVHRNLSVTKDNMYEIELENGEILQITGNHKVYTKKGKKRVDRLSLSDELVGV